MTEKLRIMLAGSFLAVTCLLGGCGYFAQFDNVQNATRLRVGMTKSEVLEIMGEPVQDEIFTTPNIWFYYVNTQWHDGLTTEDECMPLIFENDRLIGFGNDFYNGLKLQQKHVIKD